MIVVIGVLAAITIVAYSGISSQAVAASLKSDLSNAARQLKVFQVDNGSYPTSIATCPATAGTMCLKPSSKNEFLGYGRPTAESFVLDAKNGNTVFRVTDNTAPSEVAPLTAIAAVGGTAQRGQLLTAGALTPSGGTATYQWQSASTAGGVYSPIAGATASTYRPVLADVGRFIRVVATGSGTYWDSVTSTPTLQIASIAPTVLTGFTAWSDWGVYQYLDPTCCDYEFSQPSTTFNLASYVTGSMEDVSLTWEVDSVAGEAVTRQVMAATPRSTLLTIPSGTSIPTSYSGANLADYVNARRGQSCTINWEVGVPAAQYEVRYSRLIRNPRLTFTWIPG